MFLTKSKFTFIPLFFGLTGLVNAECPEVDISASQSEVEAALLALTRQADSDTLSEAGDINGETYVSLLIVVEGCVDMLQWMVNEYGSSYVESLSVFNLYGMNALHLAVDKENLAITKILLDIGMDVDVTMTRPLLFGPGGGGFDSLEVLEAATALDIAIIAGNDDIKELLQEASGPWWKFW